MKRSLVVFACGHVAVVDDHDPIDARINDGRAWCEECGARQLIRTKRATT